jgi:hypothetical protein
MPFFEEFSVFRNDTSSYVRIAVIYSHKRNHVNMFVFLAVCVLCLRPGTEVLAFSSNVLSPRKSQCPSSRPLLQPAKNIPKWISSKDLKMALDNNEGDVMSIL